MSTQAKGALLRVARQLRGFQQGDAAKRLGVPQTTLSRIENEVINPSEAVIERGAKVYSLPASFFEQPDPVYGAPVSVHPMWRRKASVTGREMDHIVAELNVRVMHIRRLLEATEFAGAQDVPRLDVEEYDGNIERIAGLVRAHWRVPNGPVRNVTELVERAGIVVMHSSLGGSTVSGVTFSAPGMPPLIVLNSDQPADRMRFTLSHEVGHIVMHRLPTPAMEQEANEFASAFLMPNNEIRPALRRRIDLPLLAQLKPEWKVSMAALLYRAKTLGALTPNQERYLWQQFNMRHIRHREPPELDFPVEAPGASTELFRLHLEELGYSLGGLAAMLHMEPDELTRFYGLKAGGGRGIPPRLRVVK